ncbi:DNA-binding Lrp family transcriptional regulator [Rhizobium mongolense]|uniref:DNA-binding Lrp family transcriptional regulator n=1 Tax=Rhizobium mongolense TaxID=57676 RepID=A0ABR6IYZ1_9HYPH|nr:DNA-binding Lrp family transcriptional regulator [Rhizobium mongolense]
MQVAGEFDARYAEILRINKILAELFMELHRTDVALLNPYKNNRRLSSEELAERTNLSPTACQRRLKRLRSEGVIEADVSIVSPKAVDRRVTVVVLVSLERERADIIDRSSRQSGTHERS